MEQLILDAVRSILVVSLTFWFYFKFIPILDQVSYERPLLDFLKEKLTTKEKKKQEVIKECKKEFNVPVGRVRNKKKFNHVRFKVSLEIFFVI